MSREKDCKNVYIEISGIPEEFDDQMILLYLENKFEGFEKFSIENFNVDRRTSEIVVKDQSIAEKILNGYALEWQGKKMMAKKLVHFSKHQTEEELNCTDLKTVKLKGDFRAVGKESLEFYLENERNGGGKILNLSFYDLVPYVIFENSKVAKTFSKKNHSFLDVQFCAELVEGWPLPDSPCGIEIRFSSYKNVKISIIECILESKRNGGEPNCIEDIFIDGRDVQRAVVTFTCHEVVKNIMEKTDGSIKFDDEKMILTKLLPAKPPVHVENPDKRKLLFSSLDACSIKVEEFKTFIEKCSRVSIQKLFFCPIHDRVLVQFNSDPDYKNILLVLCCKPFQGTMISVQRIAKTQKIHVTGCNGSKDYLLYYFESEKHGMGKVKDISEIEKGSYIVSLEDSDDVERVLLKSHEFSVSPFIEELGVIPKGFDVSRPPSNIPDNIKIPISREIYGFLYENYQYKNEIESALSDLNCSITWPVSIENLDVELSFSKNQPFLHHSTSWSGDVANCLNQMLDQYDFCEVQIDDLQFSFVSSEVRKFKPGKDKLLKRIEEQNGLIFAVGVKSEVENLKKIIHQSHKRAKNVKIERVFFEPQELELIMEHEFHKNLEKEYKVMISLEAKERNVSIEGQAENVMNCRVKLEEFKKKIKQDELDWIGTDQKFLRFFEKKEIIARCKAEFSVQKIIVATRVVRDSLMIYSTGDMKKIRDCCKSMITLTQHPCDDKMREAVRTEDWFNFCNNSLLPFKDTFEWQMIKKNLHVIAFSRDAQKINKEIASYFDENTKKTQLLPVSTPVRDFLTRYSTEYLEICATARSVDVDLAESNGPKSGLQLIGKRKDVALVMKELELLCSKVIKKSFNMDGKAKNIFGSSFSNTLRGICSIKKVNIIPKGLNCLSSDNINQSKKLKEKSEIKIKVYPGLIAEQKTDVIFNCCSPDLDLRHSAISKAILTSAGQKIQDELKKTPSVLPPGEIVETPGFNLHASRVYHGHCTPWNKGNEESERTMRNLIKNSLEKARLDSRQSISFPAFGTGKLGVPQNRAATFMLDEAFRFSRGSSSSSSSALSEINFVVYPEDKAVLNAFRNEMDSFETNSSDQSPTRGDEARRRNSDDEDDEDGEVLLKGHEIKMVAVSGDLTLETCDAIVNSTSRSLKLEAGALSRAIVKKAGNQVVKECEKIGSLEKGWAITSSGEMSNCKHIIHATGRSAKDWERVISGFLREANENGFRSIAMPLLGTGHQNICLEEFAVVFLNCFGALQTLTNLKLKVIKVMIPNESMFTDFVKAVKVLSGRGSSARASSPVKRDRGSSEKIEIEIYGMSNESIDRAHWEINQEIDKIVTIKEIPYTLKNNKEYLFHNVCKKFDVRVKIERNKVKVSGNSDISKAVEEIHKIINEQTKTEARQKHLEDIAKFVRWSYADVDGKRKSLPLHQNAMLETALQKKEHSISLDKDSKKYIADLQKMILTIDNNSFPLHRTLTDQLPVRWEDMDEAEVVKMVALKSDSDEYKHVLGLFHAGAIKPSVKKIERIQNPGLYKQYACKKHDLEAKNKANEVRVWHGTRPANVDSINASNFNRSFGNQGSYGVGVYFAVNPDYSIRSYCPPLPTTGEKFIYLARVLVGKVGSGAQGLREPPVCNMATGERFDSVSDTTPPSMYVVFYDCQMYPEYLITFT